MEEIERRFLSETQARRSRLKRRVVWMSFGGPCTHVTWRIAEAGAETAG
jgi:hypothetical protein